MLKKLIILLAIFSISACKTNAVDPAEDSIISDSDFIIDDKSQDSFNAPSEPLPEDQSFETIPDEQAAVEMNKKTEEAIEEVEVKDRVFFAYDSNELNEEAKKALDVQASWLKSDTVINVLIEGHCDEKGTREYNIALGERRALATKDYLVANGVSAARVKTVSYGKERPAFVGSTEEILAKNRRAVTVIEN